MLKQLLIFFCFSLSHVFHAQVTVYQDVFRGEVTYVGLQLQMPQDKLVCLQIYQWEAQLKKYFWYGVQ